MRTVEQTDFCPEHNTPAKQEYFFGPGPGDSVVTVYDGCRCATAAPVDQLAGDATYHESYDQAAGRARLIVAQAEAW